MARQRSKTGIPQKFKDVMQPKVRTVSQGKAKRYKTATILQMMEYIHTIEESTRKKIADKITEKPVRTYEDLTDITMFIAACVARGELPLDIAQMIKNYFDMAYMNVAARGKSEVTKEAGNALSQIIAAMNEKETPKLQASYTMDNEINPVFVDILLPAVKEAK